MASARILVGLSIVTFLVMFFAASATHFVYLLFPVAALLAVAGLVSGAVGAVHHRRRARTLDAVWAAIAFIIVAVSALAVICPLGARDHRERWPRLISAHARGGPSATTAT